MSDVTVAIAAQRVSLCFVATIEVAAHIAQPETIQTRILRRFANHGRY